ncbi:restriction endonuclease subunit S [Limosilactobacillus ingluviei]
MVKMKDSEIEWIGEIPETWKVASNKFVMIKIKQVIPKYTGEPILSLSMTGVHERNLDDGGKMPSTFDGYQVVKRGNLLLCLFDIDVTPRCVGYIQADGITSPAYSQYEVNDNSSAKYYYYYYLMIDNSKILVHLTKSLRNTINADQFDNIKAIVPPKSEQQQIADYLDHKTAEIDGLIEKINTEIETLKQYQSSVITQVVTKGLDPNVPMKDSGIEWIGEIPEKWETIKIKYLVSKLERGTAPKYTELHETQVVNQATFSKGFFDKGNLRYSTIPASQSRGLLQYQDVLVASTGGGVLGKVHYFTEHEEFVADSHVTIVRFIAQKLIPKFGYYYLSTLYDVFNNVMAQGSTNQIELKRDTFANSFIPFPRIEEQRVISDYLDKKVTQIQKLINSKQQQINQLIEYKNSLIFEYVTGKKQVKEAN